MADLNDDFMIEISEIRDFIHDLDSGYNVYNGYDPTYYYDAKEIKERIEKNLKIAAKAIEKVNEAIKDSYEY